MSTTQETPDAAGLAPALESSIPAHLLREDRHPKHRPGTYTPPYPSFSARFGGEADSVVMAMFGVQRADGGVPGLGEDTPAEILASLQGDAEEFAGLASAPDGPGHRDRSRFVDAAGYATELHIAYWADPAAFRRWLDATGRSWLDPAHTGPGHGRFLELVTPSLERVETIFSSVLEPEGVANVGVGLSGQIEEHGYWGSMRDRLPFGQDDELWPSGETLHEASGETRTVVLPHNACLIRSGQDITDTEQRERAMYMADVEPALRAGMDFLRDDGGGIGCHDNRYMVIVDEEGRPTDRTFGMSWWRSMAHLEEWAASHPTHVAIFGAAMRHLGGMGPDARLRLYHEVTVPAAGEQRFVYIGCHGRTGMLRVTAAG